MNNPPGWYKDPYSEAERFWDGYAWTSETRMPESKKSSSNPSPKRIALFALGVLIAVVSFLAFMSGKEETPVNSNFIIERSKAQPEKIVVDEAETYSSENLNTGVASNGLVSDSTTNKPSTKPSTKPTIKTTSRASIKPSVVKSIKPSSKPTVKKVTRKPKATPSSTRVLP